MKSVGKQLQEARLAKNWTPELAARETKIKIDRLRDLEADDYTHFSSPTYARGFVRTYARSLGLDEYKILRQLDNKLPDDDTSTIVTDSGIPYIPETSLPPRAAHKDYTALYVVLTLAMGILFISAFVIFEAYRVGELPHLFANSASSDAATNASETNAAPTTESEAPPQAIPVDQDDTNHAPKAEAVDPASLAAEVPVTPGANSAPSTASPTEASNDTSVHAVKALPVDPSDLTNTVPIAPVATADNSAAPTTTSVTSGTSPDGNTPRALPVDPSELAATAPVAPVAATNAAPQSSPAPTPPPPVASLSARGSNASPVAMPSAPIAPAVSAPDPPIAPPAPVPATAPIAPTTAIPQTTSPSPAPDPTADSDAGKRLILTASQDSFVRVTSLDTPDSDKPLYASVLHSGQSVGFDGHKFSINVGIPSAVDIKLDGVNYGPHSDQEAPETFTVESHLQ